MRKIDITKGNSVLREKISIETDGICLDYDVRFDVDKYFGTNTQYENGGLKWNLET